MLEETQDNCEKIVWFVDNDVNQLQQYRRLLEAGIQDILGTDSDICVREVFARPHKNDYLDLLADPKTAALLIDQVLKDKGGVDHTGIELAQYLRTISRIMPLYILTNYPAGDEYEDKEWNVEEIIDKGDLINDYRLAIILNRLMRRVGVYEQLHDVQEARFRALLKKSINDTLTEAEEQELGILELERSAALIAFESLKEKMPNQLDEVLSQLRDLRQQLEQFDDMDEE